MHFHFKGGLSIKKSFWAACFASSLITILSNAAEIKTNAIENSVVKIFSTVVYPDLSKPWAKRAPMEMSGSGVIIEGKRILSNAHLFLYANQVQVQANQAGDKVTATVEAIAPGIDLAVLKLDDETFFDSHPPLPFSKTLPEIKDSVMAYGYPEGGNGLSITKGIVSRIEFVGYKAGVSGLRIQIDAAINPGNSGGPAVVSDNIIGLAFSRLNDAQNIGYIIPSEEIELFLQDIADGHYDGKPDMYNELQTLENPALRKFLKLDASVHGIMVNKPESSNGAYPLKEWDVITKIGDTPVDDQGMIKVRDDLSVRLDYLVQKIAKNAKVSLAVVREGKEIQVEVPVATQLRYVTPELKGAYPSYFIYGPFVFSTLTQEFILPMMAGSRGWWVMAQHSPVVTRLMDQPTFEGENLVVVTTQFFPHKLARGYSDPFGQVVKTVNGVNVENLGHLVKVLRDSKDEFINIEFDNRRGDSKLVFPRADMVAATEEILSANGIRSQGSPDVLAIWNAKQ